MKYREPQYGDCPEHGHVEAAWIDEGIGWYEAWGHKGYDSRPVAVCPECEEPLDDVG
jgi:hypothetical protein